jgi:hypothetical protein
LIGHRLRADTLIYKKKPERLILCGVMWDSCKNHDSDQEGLSGEENLAEEEPQEQCST